MVKLTKDQIKATEVVGKSEDGNDIVHVETKGGLNMMVKRAGGDFRILSQAPHRGIARFHANVVEKNIQWAEHLMKAEEMYKPSMEVIQVVESTPDKHRAVAIYSSAMMNKSEGDDKLCYLERAMSHFKASGLDHQAAVKAVAIAQAKLQKGYTMDEPYDSEILKIAFERKYKKPFPNGIEG